MRRKGGRALNTTVHILDYGTNVCDFSELVVGQGQGRRVKIPCIGLFIDHPKAKILVDTGVSDLNTWQAKNWEHTQSAEQTPMAQLAKHGVHPDEIDCVVLTHLHWDHCGNSHCFPKAKIFVRREELEKAYVPLTKNDVVFDRSAFDRNLDYEIVPNGIDFELCQGVSVISSPGHSAGLQSVLVSTRIGNVLYASDAMYTYLNWYKKLMPGICYNSELHARSAAKLRAYRDVILVPSHDPELDIRQTLG